MKNSVKHIGIVFSVALNVGFIVAAIFVYFNHPFVRHNGYLASAEQIIQKMDLSAQQHKELKGCLEQFKQEIASVGGAYRQTRTEMLTLLATADELDEERFDTVCLNMANIFSKKQEIMKKHLFAIRTAIGKEKSSVFFSGLLQRFK